MNGTTVKIFDGTIAMGKGLLNLHVLENIQFLL